jgi:hypothetical protein
MQKVTFTTGETIEAESVRGDVVNGRQALIFTVPESETTFEQLKTIFTDEAATEEITVEYKTEDDGGEITTEQNIQTGYIVPVSLSYEVGKFIMTLGRQTQTDALIKRVEQLENTLTANKITIPKDETLKGVNN